MGSFNSPLSSIVGPFDMAGGYFHQEQRTEFGSFGEAVEMHIFLVAVDISASNAQIIHVGKTSACQIVAVTTAATVAPL